MRWSVDMDSVVVLRAKPQLLKKISLSRQLLYNNEDAILKVLLMWNVSLRLLPQNSP